MAAAILPLLILLAAQRSLVQSVGIPYARGVNSTSLPYDPRPAPAYMVDNQDNYYHVAPDKGKHNGPVWSYSGSLDGYLSNLQRGYVLRSGYGGYNGTSNGTRQTSLAFPAQKLQSSSDYWLSKLAQLGSQPFAGGKDYQFFRNVVDDFGADNSGKSDTAEALNSASASWNKDSVGGKQTRCGQQCGNTFSQGAILFFPGGTYKICSPVIQYYYTQFVGDPIIKGCDKFLMSIMEDFQSSYSDDTISDLASSAGHLSSSLDQSDADLESERSFFPGADGQPFMSGPGSYMTTSATHQPSVQAGTPCESAGGTGDGVNPTDTPSFTMPTLHNQACNERQIRRVDLEASSAERGFHYDAANQRDHLRSILAQEVSEEDYEERKRLHDQDSKCRWFEVTEVKNGCVEMKHYQRYRRLIEEHCIQHGTAAIDCYPRLVSFLGSTGAGKSSLIRMLIEQSWLPQPPNGFHFTRAAPSVPIIGHEPVPTSGNVHLYRETVMDRPQEKSPLLFADCEGFNGGGGGEFKYALKNPDGTDNDSTPKASFFQRGVDFVCKSINLSSKKGLSDCKKRKDIVEKVFPRLLYNVSDVVIYVLPYDVKKQLGAKLEDLINWTNKSESAAVNRMALPHLIIVLNRCDGYLNEMWDTAKTKESLLKTQDTMIRRGFGPLFDIIESFKMKIEGIDTTESLLKLFYSSIEFILIPNLNPRLPLASQLKRLHEMIAMSSQQSLAAKEAGAMRLHAKEMRHFFDLCFDHILTGSNTPFNLLEALLATKPLPDTLSSYFLGLMKHALKTIMTVQHGKEPEEMASSLSSSVAPVICSMVALDLDRTYNARIGNIKNLYRGKYTQPESEATVSNKSAVNEEVKDRPEDEATATYESAVKKALKEFLETSVECCFINGGLKCINSKRSHENVSHHKSSDGELIGQGNFDATLAQEIEAQLNASIERGFDSMASSRQQKPDTVSLWEAHDANLANIHRFSSRPTEHFPRCFWCIRNTATEYLPCRHGICNACIQLKGEASRQDSRVFKIGSCALHAEPADFDPPVEVLILPATVGRRILTIEGDGVRGAISLKILAAVEKLLGTLKMGDFFDLIVGCGSGGLVALALTLKTWTLDEIGQKIFNRVYSEDTLPSRWWFAQPFAKESHYEEKLKRVLDEIFGSCSQSKLGQEYSRNLLTGRPGVMIPVIREDGSKLQYVTNYKRRTQEGVEADHFRIWQVARATMAIQKYFPPLIYYKREDQVMCFSGANEHIGCLDQTAIDEAEQLWPGVEGTKRLDLFLSVGCSVKKDASKCINELEKKVANEEPKKIVRLSPKVIDGPPKFVIDGPPKFVIHGPPPFVIHGPPPFVIDGLPQIDDFDALKERGPLARIVTNYLQDKAVKTEIENLVLSLLATSLYFQVTKKDEREGFNHKGQIKCRFPNGSDTAKIMATLFCNCYERLWIEIWNDDPTTYDLRPKLQLMKDTGTLNMDVTLTYREEPKNDCKLFFFLKNGARSLRHISGSPMTLSAALEAAEFKPGDSMGSQDWQ